MKEKTNGKITQNQFNKCIDLISELQNTVPDIDTSSVNMSLSMFEVIEDEKEPADESN